MAHATTMAAEDVEAAAEVLQPRVEMALTMSQPLLKRRATSPMVSAPFAPVKGGAIPVIEDGLGRVRRGAGHDAASGA